MLKNIGCLLIGFMFIPGILFANDFDEPTYPQLSVNKFAEEDDFQLLNKAAITTGDGFSNVSLNIIKYTLKLGDDAEIPLYMYSTTPTKTKLTKERVIDSILDRNGGVLNFSIGSDKAKPFSVGKVCKFADASSGNGCFFMFKGGIKMGETPEETGVDSTYFYSAYFSAGLKADFPIYDSADSKAGYLVFNLNANAHYINADKIDHLFSTKPEDTFATVDAGVSFYIENQISISAGGTISSTDKEIDKRVYFTVSLTGE